MDYVTLNWRTLITTKNRLSVVSLNCFTFYCTLTQIRSFFEMTFTIYRISAMSTVGYITMHKESSLWHLLRPDDTQHVLFPPVEVLSAVISLPVAADYQRITVPISSEKINLIICKRNYSSLEEIQLSQGYV